MIMNYLTMKNNWNKEDFFRNTSIRDLKKYLAAEFDINARGCRGQEPLRNAMEQDNIEAMKILVDAGADIESRDPFQTGHR